MSPAALISPSEQEPSSALHPCAPKDPRNLPFLGEWKRVDAQATDIMARDDLDEPHRKRKLEILENHPEITTLYGYDSRTVWITLSLVILQLGVSYYFGKVYSDSWIALLVAAYFIGGTASQIFGVVIHEATHGLCGRSPLYNRFVGLLANVGMPFPISQSFRRYHLEHHAYQGVMGQDPDLPMQWENTFIGGNIFFKSIWLFCFPVMYVVRGLALKKVPSSWEIANVIFTLSTDYAVYHFCGPMGLAYLVASLWFGYGIHPAAGHFIQEHYTFEDGQETYSYYGGLNRIFMNIGYHNEHHDFTKVPWSKLPEIKRMAPEYYDSLAAHYSWSGVIWRYLTDPTVGPQSRVGRDKEDHVRGRNMITKKGGKKDD